jgi:hypothetical protein
MSYNKTLPDYQAMLLEARDLLNTVMDILVRDPDNVTVLPLLKSATAILKRTKDADMAAFDRYAAELAERVYTPDFPHSVKAWYEDDFVFLLKERASHAE